MNIVITGAGIVSAIGIGKVETAASLLQERTGIAPLHYLNCEDRHFLAGEVKLTDEEMKERLGINTEPTTRTSLMGMMALEEALTEAALWPRNSQATRVALVSGTTVGGMDKSEQFYLDFLENDRHNDYILTHDCGSTTELMARRFGIFSMVTTPSTACSSAANAIVMGANLLRSGLADVVVAGGAECISRFHLNGFNSLMIIDHEQCRPFDANRAGLNLGEGAAYLVLESADHARRRGIQPLACLKGFGNACDAFHQTASSDNGEGAYLAMQEALSMAQLTPEDIDYVNAHGTGTPNNDLSESTALKRIFGEQMPAISSTKAFTGHTTSASGSIETVICLLAMQHHFIPANLRWANQIEGGITPSQGQTNCELKHVICNAFGFGGNDSSLVLSAQPEGDGSFLAGTCFRPEKNRPLVVTRVEISDENELAEIKNYVKPMEARRMGKIMKSSLLASLKALDTAGLEKPDAIITATSLGCLENSERLLEQLRDEGEVMLKPTYFMQSTHNTIGSAIAINTGCHGYNITYTHGEQSLEWAMRDAELLLSSGKARNVLVGLHEETTPLWRSLMGRLGVKDLPSIHSIAMILTCGK